MGRISKEFVKMETRLLNDHRFFTLTEWEQLFYIKLILISRSTDNKIPRSEVVLTHLLRTKRPLKDIKVTLKRLLANFPKFKSNKHFYYFDGYDMRLGSHVPKLYPNGTPDEEEDKEEDIEKQGTLEILQYLNTKASKNYKPVPANIKFIMGRLKEGYLPADLKRVIDAKVVEWTGTDMEKYLRPETLFNSTKFQNYVQVKAEPTKPKERWECT